MANSRPEQTDDIHQSPSAKAGGRHVGRVGQMVNQKGMHSFWQNYNKFALAIPSKINIIALDFKRLALNGNTL